MEVDDPGFKPVILSIFNRWEGLKMVVEHSMGGRDSLDKAWYLVDYVHQIFRDNQSVEAEDLEDVLVEYMDTECNTVLEDDSAIEISRALVRLFSVYSTTGLSAVEEELRTLPPVAEWLNVNTPRVKRTQVIAGDVSSSDSSEGEDEGGEAMEEGEMEWTRVSYGKKR